MDDLFTQQPCNLKPANATTLDWCTTLSNLSLHFGASDRCETCGEYQAVTGFMATVHRQTEQLINERNLNQTLRLTEEVSWLYWISRVRRQLEPDTNPPTGKTLLLQRPWFMGKQKLLEETRTRACLGQKERSLNFLNAWHAVLSDNQSRPMLYLINS